MAIPDSVVTVRVYTMRTSIIFAALLATIASLLAVEKSAEVGILAVMTESIERGAASDNNLGLFNVSNQSKDNSSNSDIGCKNGEYGIKKDDSEKLLRDDCIALLAIKNHWLSDLRNSHLGAGHALRSWGVGDIESWSGIEVDFFPVDDKSLRNNCAESNKGCVRRVMSVDLSVPLGFFGNGKIVGTIPDDFAKLSALVYLNLGNNLLDGEVPSILGNVSEPYCNKSERARYIDLPFDPPFIDWPNYHFPRSEIDLDNKDCRVGSVRRGSSDSAVSGDAGGGTSFSADTGSSLSQRAVNDQSDEGEFSLFAAGEFLQRRMPNPPQPTAPPPPQQKSKH